MQLIVFFLLLIALSRADEPKENEESAIQAPLLSLNEPTLENLVAEIEERLNDAEQIVISERELIEIEELQRTLEAEVGAMRN